MKITGHTTTIARLPADEPLANGPTIAGTRDFVTLSLHTDQPGLSGIGVTFFGGPLTPALRQTVDLLAALIVGDDPLRIEAVVAKLRTAAGTAGPAGMFTLALSAIDIALWDIKGKALGVSVSVLAGGHRTTVPTYASGALMRHFTLDQGARAAQTLVEQGWRQMKTQLALPAPTSIRKEEERIRVIREAIGPDIDLMCDINQRWDVRQAISIGQRVEQYDLFWLEDVVAPDDHPGMAAVARALNTPLAAGEYVYGAVPFRHMLEARSVDIVMIDVLRAGGITGWLKIAAMAQAFNLPVVSHLLPEVHVHLISAIPNGLTVEFMPWSNPLFREVPRMQKGVLDVPQKPGLGLEFDEDALARWRG